MMIFLLQDMTDNENLWNTIIYFYFNDNDNDNELYSWSQVETKEPGGQHDIIQYLHYL